MDLPITLTQAGFAIGGILVGALSKISHWILLETLEQRKRRREWYSDVATLANRVNQIHDSNNGIAYLDDNFYYISHESVGELKEIEKELGDLINKPIDVDFSVERDANALYDVLTDLNNHLDIQSVESDNDRYIIPKTNDDSSFFGQVNNMIDRIDERSLEVNDKATKKAKGGYTIPILNVKV